MFKFDVPTVIQKEDGVRSQRLQRPLKMFRYFCVTLLALANAQIDPSEKCDRQVDVAIVGAGPSGAYSSYLLRKSNLNIEVVELTDRVGGRVKTFRFPQAENIPVELGPSTYTDSHEIMKNLVEELELEPGKSWMTRNDEARYVMRGQSFTEGEIRAGAKLPYKLTDDEQKNQARLAQFYLEQLTGYTGDDFPPSIRLHLRVKVPDTNGKKDIPLYQYNLSQALDLVASKEGKELFYALLKQKSAAYQDASALIAFSDHFDLQSKNVTVSKIKEGMEALPQRLIEKFVNEDKNRHTLKLNRKLDAIASRGERNYILKLRRTRTTHSQTYETGPEEHLCAEKVILALPTSSLKVIQWETLRSGLMYDALDSVKSLPVSKIAMVFNKQHWLENENKKAKVAIIDDSITKVYEMGKSNTSNTYVFMASFAEGEKVRDLEDLMIDRKPAAESESFPEENQISEDLRDHILSKLNDVFGTTFEKPVASIGMFWTKFPQTGGKSVWRANRNYDQVKTIVERPSLHDEVYIVGSDFAWNNLQVWLEGSLETVHSVMTKYFQ
ncbi:hypothetical protein Btru_004989 [Bulinus truncatus]|nr:hypothetical protein Btru_004989 [Bulinus truncatus]